MGDERRRADNRRPSDQFHLVRGPSLVVGVGCQSNKTPSHETKTHDHTVMCSNSNILVVGVDQQRNNSLHLLPPTLVELKRMAREAQRAGEVPMAEPKAGVPPRRLRRRLAGSVVEEIVRRYNDGATTPQLSKEYGISKGGLLGLLRRKGVQLRRQPLADDIVAEATRLYVDGMAIAKVAERLGVPRETMRRSLVDAGVAMRPRGGRYDSVSPGPSLPGIVSA